MGRHKDPEILSFIESLKSEGISLGFQVIDEFKLWGGLFFVDLVWTPYKEHGMFITFEIEKKDERTLKNFDKIFETPASKIEKPYHHFIIIYDEKLSPSDRVLVDEKSRYHNIHVFEDVKHSSKEFQKLLAEVEQLQIEIKQLIEIRGKVSASDTIEETLKGLSSFNPVLVVNDFYPFDQITTDSSGVPIDFQPICLPSDKIFDRKKYKGYAIVPIPKDKYLLVIPGSAITYDVYFESNWKKNTKIRYTLNFCDYPIMIKVMFNKTGHGGETLTQIDPEEADAIILKRFLNLIETLEKMSQFTVYDNKSNVVLSGRDEKSETQLDPIWHDRIETLARLQLATGKKIKLPKALSFSGEELKVLEILKKILANGEYAAKLKPMDVPLNKEKLIELCESQINTGAIRNLQFSQEDNVVEILQQKISLGPVVLLLPEMIFNEPIKSIEQKIIEMDDEPITVSIITKSPDSMGLFKWQNFVKK